MTLEERLTMYQQKVSSMQYSAQEVKRKLSDYDDQRLEEMVHKAVEQINRAAEFEFSWSTSKNARSDAREGSVETDNKIDRTISSIYQVARAIAETPSDSPKKEYAERLADEVFPNGVYPITSVEFQEQRMHVDELLGKLTGEYAECIDELGLSDELATLQELQETFREQLSRVDHEEVTFDEVQAARVEAREAYHRMVAVIMGNYCDDPECFRDLMEPIDQQQDKIRRYVTRRGEIPEVDPESGEPTEPTPDDQPTDAPDGDTSDGDTSDSDQPTNGDA